MIKQTMFAACLAALILAALPVGAGAEEEGEPYLKGVKTGTEFSLSGGASELRAVGEKFVRCESVEGEGEFDDGQVGAIKLTFQGCRTIFKIPCTTSGEASGTIAMETEFFSLKTVEHKGELNPGMLIEGFGATFKCSFAGNVEIRSNGLVGTITSPKEKEASNTATISFAPVEKESGIQTHQTVANDETSYHLEASFNGGPFEEASEEATGTLTFAEGMKPELETTPTSSPYLAGEGEPIENTGFTVSGGASELITVGGKFVRCKSATGSGLFEDSETGSIKFTFHECVTALNIPCTTTGEPSGTVTTTILPFHLKTIEHGSKKTPGVLITPAAEGHLATFKCSFAGQVVVKGSGLVGTITSPKEKEASNTATISFAPVEKESGIQTHQTVANDETNYRLEASFNGGPFEEDSEEATGTITFAEGMKPEIRT